MSFLITLIGTELRLVRSKPGAASQALLAVTVAGDRLSANLSGQQLTLVARDQTTFGVAEQPVTTITFRIEQDKAAAVTFSAMGNSITFTRVEDK